MICFSCQTTSNSRISDTGQASTSGRFLVHSGCTGGALRSSRLKYQTAWHRSQSVVLRAVAEGQLTSWLDLPADRLAVKETSQGGLVTTRRVGRGQALLTIPATQWITTETVSKSDIGPYVERLQPWIQVALFILHEKAQARTIWGSYIGGLQDNLESLLLWSDEELEKLLEGTQLLGGVQGYREFFSNKFSELQAEVFQKAPELFSQPAFSLDNFLWAAAVLRAKVHPPLDGDNLALVPLADKVSHQRGPGAAWKVSPGGFGRGGKALLLEAQRDFESGEAVTMDFGPEKLDAEILLNYGQMDEFVTRAGFTLNLALPEEDRFYDDKADIADVNGLTTAQDFALVPGQDPSGDMLAYLRLINLSGVDAFLLESLFRNEAWGHLSKPVSLENETAVFQSMMDGCREALADYKNLADDKAALRSTEAGSRLEKALRIRIGEKEALDATLEFFEDRFDRLSRLEFYQERRLKGLGLLDEDGRSTFDDFFKDGIA